MTKIFKPLIGQTMEVYIGNIVVKSKTRAEHVQNLEEMFCLMRQAYNMKLNPAKCAFYISAGKFLGFMVTQSGIEVNSAQIMVVLETPPSNSKKELQRLRLSSSFGAFHSPFHKQVETFLPHTQGSKHV
ncbi:hypothetical protein CK203_083878 [Vitis vinifera]|uniref:Reverse transcriptase domain-containing protein n=1 Tax=Vitis vinifera TaxID=29760 RepID=A0A438BU95_VITVI|nr:hypothetical protein CK203_083878 [Vitis vinifera]